MTPAGVGPQVTRENNVPAAPVCLLCNTFIHLPSRWVKEEQPFLLMCVGLIVCLKAAMISDNPADSVPSDGLVLRGQVHQEVNTSVSQAICLSAHKLIGGFLSL